MKRTGGRKELLETRARQQAQEDDRENAAAQPGETPLSVPEAATKRPRQWIFDFGGAPAHPPHNSSLPAGFILGNFSAAPEERKSQQAETKKELMYKSAMSTATAPGKSIFMTALMLWMAGSGLNIFTIMMVGMAFAQPIRGLLGVGATFKRYEGKIDLGLHKLIFIVCNLLNFAVVLYKINTLGLLPTPADWVSDVVRLPTELSFTAIAS